MAGIMRIGAAAAIVGPGTRVRGGRRATQLHVLPHAVQATAHSSSCTGRIVRMGGLYASARTASKGIEEPGETRRGCGSPYGRPARRLL